MKLSENEFRKKIAELKSVLSKRDQIVYDITIKGEEIEVFRQSTKKTCKIKLSKLYDFYINESDYTTSAAKKYVDRVQSPAVAIISKLTEHN